MSTIQVNNDNNKVTNEEDDDLSPFHRRDLFLHLLLYLKMKEICYILAINKQLYEWITYYATYINRSFGLPFHATQHRSLWMSIHHLMSKTILWTKPYVIPHIEHKENIYFISYKAPYLLLVSWDHSFTIINIQQTNQVQAHARHPDKPSSIHLNVLSTFGANNCDNHFGLNKEKLFKFNTWEQFYSIDFVCYDTKLYIAFGGNINLYVAIFDVATNKYEIVSHAYEEPQEFDHANHHQSRERNQHWIRTCKMAPKHICDLNHNGYVLIVSGHGYDGEVFGVLAVDKECRIVYQDITRMDGYVGCALQTRSIEFYYDQENDIRLLILTVVFDDKPNVLLVYSIKCLKYKVELRFINQIVDNDSFGGAIAMRNEYLVTTGGGGAISLWKIDKDCLNTLVRSKQCELKHRLFEWITDYQFLDVVDEGIGFINEICFFHDDFFVVSGSAGVVLMLHIDESVLQGVKTWISQKDGFWSVCNANNYVLCGNEDGKLCCYSF
eukprot:246863_1